MDDNQKQFVNSFSRDANANPQTRQTENSPQEIERVLEQWADLFRQADIDGILKLYSDDVVAFDMMPPLQYSGKQDYRKAWVDAAEMGKAPWVYKSLDRKIFVSGDVAFTHCLAECGGADPKTGKIQSGWIRHTQGLKKFGDQWRIVHDTTSVPLDMKSGKALMDLKPESLKH